MRFSSILLLVLILSAATLAATRIAGSGKPAKPKQDRCMQETVSQTAQRHFWPAKSAAQADTTVLAEYTFDSGGAPDPQGWTTHDVTAQADTFFHVAGVAELDGGNGGTLLPLQGVQSLWCGLAPSAQPPACGYETLPGYGNVWRQCFELLPLPVEGDVIVSYKVQWDTEAGYDYAFVEYYSQCGYFPPGWAEAPVNGGIGQYDGAGNLIESFTIPDSCLADTLKMRFWFVSDEGFSDEDGIYPTDGAVLVDSIVVADATGIIDYQDFEAEPPGALQTLDGHWRANVNKTFGDYAALHAGSTVVQQDTLYTNLTHLWGFFDDPANGYYNCGGEEFPEQGIIPRGYDYSSYPYCLEINNEIRSPQIPISGIGDDMLLSFRVYRDMPLDGYLFYVWRIRSWVAGCPQRWKGDGYLYHGSQKSWYDAVFSMHEYIDPSASHIQVAIGVVDRCSYWCIFGCGDWEACHRHTPLIDDVVITRIDTTGTAVAATPYTSFLAGNYPNPFNPHTTIRFGTAAAGRVSLNVYDVRGRLVRTLDDAYRPAGVHAVRWDGKTNAGTTASSGIYFYQLVAPGFTETKKMILLK